MRATAPSRPSPSNRRRPIRPRRPPGARRSERPALLPGVRRPPPHPRAGRLGQADRPRLGGAQALDRTLLLSCLALSFLGSLLVFSATRARTELTKGDEYLFLLGVVLWRACRIARETGELYGTIVASGIVAGFAFQSFENIGMTLGIMPVTGLPLPFVSYGGTSMFAVRIAIGLLQPIRVQRPVSASR
ncbi:hypothetical protein GCM10010211_21820 [Streptomyces albospinus]|uniref:peptidoglycan glycosyltransferase n=1 Tax=Streptomyces albospinus TaxID=285515 RepID=A0ABQ2UY29_9ACTN|nr:hypothetical protein GCM10010211_21820 [Streptomyces albospinus]